MQLINIIKFHHQGILNIAAFHLRGQIKKVMAYITVSMNLPKQLQSCEETCKKKAESAHKTGHSIALNRVAE